MYSLQMHGAKAHSAAFRRLQLQLSKAFPVREGGSFERESLQEGSLMQEFASGGGVGGMGICLLLFTPLFRCYYSLPGPPKGTPLPRSFLLLFGRFCKGKFEGAGRAGFLKIGGSRPTPPVTCRNRVAGIDLFLCSLFRRKMETCT